MNFISLTIVIIFTNLLRKTLTLEYRFLAVILNNSNSFDLSPNLKANSTIKIVNGINLLKCSSQCSLDSKCLSFSYLKSDKVCSLFSFDQIDSSNVVVELNSKIYKKISSTFTDFISTTTSTVDYTCVNQDCICHDSLSFYSTIQKKCIKCRDGWLPYKNVCYQGFANTRKWQEYVTFCSSLNSTLLMPIDSEKFNFFFQIGKNLNAINSNLRLWVSARYDFQSVYQWTNGESLNISYINPIFHDSTSTGFYAYLVGNQSPQLGLSTSGSSSNGVCEYFEIFANATRTKTTPKNSQQ